MVKIAKVLEVATGRGSFTNCRNSIQTKFPMTSVEGNVYVFLILSKVLRELSLNSLMFYDFWFVFTQLFFLSVFPDDMTKNTNTHLI